MSPLPAPLRAAEGTAGSRPAPRPTCSPRPRTTPRTRAYETRTAA